MYKFERIVLISLAGLLTSQFFFKTVSSRAAQRNIYRSKCNKKKRFMHKVSDFIGEIIVDAMMLNVNLISIDSIKVATGFTPIFLSTRMIDDRLQKNFYDGNFHKNIRQFPKQCHNIAHYTVGVPMVFLSSLAFWGWNEDLRMTGRILWIGLPFVHIGKELLKTIPIKASLRPWCEDFGKEKRSYGGFPSGHMANLTFMTALFSIRHGLSWGIPLGIYSLFVFADFLNCNRHYLSQLVGGVGLGLIFALAANKIIDQKLEARYLCDCVSDSSGGTAFKVSYLF